MATEKLTLLKLFHVILVIHSLVNHFKQGFMQPSLFQYNAGAF